MASPSHLRLPSRDGRVRIQTWTARMTVAVESRWIRHSVSAHPPAGAASMEKWGSEP